MFNDNSTGSMGASSDAAFASVLSLSAALATSPHWDRPVDGQVHIGAHTGYPWNGLQIAYSTTESWVLTAEVESAMFIRAEARGRPQALGSARQVVDLRSERRRGSPRRRDRSPGPLKPPAP